MDLQDAYRVEFWTTLCCELGISNSYFQNICTFAWNSITYTYLNHKCYINKICKSSLSKQHSTYNKHDGDDDDDKRYYWNAMESADSGYNKEFLIFMSLKCSIPEIPWWSDRVAGVAVFLVDFCLGNFEEQILQLTASHLYRQWCSPPWFCSVFFKPVIQNTRSRRQVINVTDHDSIHNNSQEKGSWDWRIIWLKCIHNNYNSVITANLFYGLHGPTTNSHCTQWLEVQLKLSAIMLLWSCILNNRLTTSLRLNVMISTNSPSANKSSNRLFCTNTMWWAIYFSCTDTILIFIHNCLHHFGYRLPCQITKTYSSFQNWHQLYMATHDDICIPAKSRW